MNKQQVKGSLKDAAGQVQRKVGEAIGSDEQQAKGAARQAEGKIEKKVGDVKQGIKTAVRKP
jgi:uncharacterized protein YjbJ (UPF0337 family)